MAEVPSVSNLVCLLQNCRKMKNLAYAKRVHAYICNNGLESHRDVGNYIVPMFVECGSLPDAQQVFNSLVHRNVYSWTSLISGYLQCGQSLHALNLYEKMQEDSVHPNSNTLTALLKACARLKSVEKGREIHVEIRQKGFERDVFVGSSLVDMYAKCGLLAEAQEVFDKLPVQNVVSWTALIAGYAEHGPAQEALQCFEQMQLQGVPPDAVTLVSILKACGSMGAMDKGQKIHMEIIRNGFESEVFVGNTLIDMYAKCGSLAEARAMFSSLPLRNVVSWNALIAGYADHGPCQEALKFFEQMQLESVSPDAVTFVYILKACGSIQSVDKGRGIHADIMHKGFERDTFVGNTLVDMYAKCGWLADAQDVLKKLPVRNVVSWTALIAGYAEHGCGQEALKCFEWMQLEGISPNSVTYVCILKACASIGAIDKCQDIHAQIKQKGFVREVSVGNSLVDVYARCGPLAEAHKIFDSLPVRDAVSWNALIAGCAEHGPYQTALTCYEQMQLEGFSPDLITLICILKACGGLGTIDKGREIHREITQKGLEEDVIVGNSLVYMYARCGSLEDAQGILVCLPAQDTVSWNALIAGLSECGLAKEALKCFECMQFQGLSPDAVTFVCILKACGNIGAIDKGREMHDDVAQKGFEGDVFVGNALVDMYARCGLFADAREVFYKVPVRNVVSWTALIGGYVEHECGQEGLRCFEEMQLEGTFPDAVTFVCVLKACGSIGDINKGREMHAAIVEKGFEGGELVGSTLVDMYAKCGSFAEAHEVFDKLQVRDVMSWNALIAGHAEHGTGQEALTCYKRMQLEDASPNVVTFTSVLKACGSIGAIDEGRELHTQITQKGFERDIFVGNALVHMYARCGSLAEAQEIFDNLLFWNGVSWNALIAGYAEHGLFQESLRCFEQMQLEGVSSNSITFISIVKACGSIGSIEKGMKVHDEILQKGYESDLFLGNSLVDMYSKCASLAEAQKVFDKLPVHDVVSWNALIEGYADQESGQEALKCFQQMQQDGISPNAVTFVGILKAVGSIGIIDKGREMHAAIAQKGFEKDVFVGSTLIDMYTRCGSLEEAHVIFDQLSARNVVSWNALIGGYAEYGPFQEAVKCFEQMQLEGICPDAVTYVCVLKACGSMVAIDKGREIHIDITKKGLERVLSIGNTLVDMYSKCGSLPEAWDVFDKLPVRDVVSRNSMIKGCGMNNECNKALQCFYEMLEEGVNPDGITLTCLLYACSRASLALKGEELFHTMREEYSIVPNIDHYTCMVDLLAKSGHLREAEKFLETMPCTPSFTALLTACKIYGVTELGLRCFHQLAQMNPEFAAPYVLMAKMYATSGRWNDAYAIEELRKGASAKKRPASALIEVNKVVHEFVVGNNQSEEVSALLKSLSARMEEAGHVPDVNLVLRTIFNGVKKAAVCEHVLVGC